MAKRVYIGVNNVARKVKKIYVGINTEFPIYETETRTINIVADNISDFFDVKNGSYYFAGNGSSFVSNNFLVSKSSATTTLTAKNDILEASFDYAVSSEKNYDKLTIVVGGTTIVDGISGINSGSWSGSLTAGQTIVLTYSKDKSTNHNDDCGTISNFVIVAKVKTQVGTEIKSIARKVKKAYIGVGGIARPFFSSEDIEYYGTITPLTQAKYSIYSGSVGNYAVFAGGTYKDSSTNSYEYTKEVIAYDNSLTRSSASNNLKTARTDIGVSNISNNYLYFAGGSNGGSTFYSTVERYNTSLSIAYCGGISPSRGDLSGANAGDYAIFAGGYTYNGEYNWKSDVDAYNSSGTHSYPNNMNETKAFLLGESIGNYALFVGGWRISNGYETVSEAYDSSLTHTTHKTLGSTTMRSASASNTNYMVIAGGTNDGFDPISTAWAYNTSLTRISAPSLSVAREELVGINLSGYLIFAGGSYVNKAVPYISDNIDIYDKSLTRQTGHKLSQGRYLHSAANAGNYALFAGGSGNPSTLSLLSSVEAYQYVKN